MYSTIHNKTNIYGVQVFWHLFDFCSHCVEFNLQLLQKLQRYLHIAIRNNVTIAHVIHVLYMFLLNFDMQKMRKKDILMI